MAAAAVAFCFTVRGLGAVAISYDQFRTLFVDASGLLYYLLFYLPVSLRL